MIVAAGASAGGKQPMLLLGLPQENIDALAAGDAVHVSGPRAASLGLPQLEVIVLGGPTEEAIAERLRGQGLELEFQPQPSAARLKQLAEGWRALAETVTAAAEHATLPQAAGDLRGRAAQLLDCAAELDAALRAPQ